MSILPKPVSLARKVALFATVIIAPFGCLHHSRAAESAEWQTPSDSDLAASRTDIRSAKEQLDYVLANTPDGQQWREYFLWDDLNAAVADATALDVVALSDARNRLLPIFTRLADDQAGLERAEVQALRVAVRTHVRQINALLVRRGPQEAEARRQRISELVNEGRWTAKAQSEYHDHLRWLHDHYQTTPSVLAATHWPNLTTAISADIIRKITTTSVSDPTDVNECIVGTRVIGSGVTSGVGWLEPIESSGEARLAARFSGVMNSDTVGYNGPVRIYSDGQTQLTGTAVLALNSKGLRQLSQHVDASADSQTKAIRTKFKGLLDRVVKKIATRKAAESKAQANWESSNKARQSFSKRFDEDILEQVTEGDASLQRFLLLPLRRRDLTPENWDWQSDPYSLRTFVGFDGRDRPASPVAVPPSLSPTNGGAGIQLAVHQSFIDNAAEGYLGGLTQKLSDIADQNGAQGKEEVSNAPNDDVVIVLDDFQPARCIFDNDMLTFHLLPKQIIAGGREAGGVIIKIQYRIERTGSGWQLRRASAPNIEPQPTFSRKPRFSVSGSAIRVIVEPRLEEELPEFLPLDLPSLDDEIPEPIRNLKISDVKTFGGWLYISLQ